MASKKTRLFNRDISWLAFNHRVLQEAADPRVPLIERLRFLAIYSSNLDEFFRVRVASIRNLLGLKEKTQKKLDLHPAKQLKHVQRIVRRQQEEFGQIFREEIIPRLNDHGIAIINESDLTERQEEQARSHFQTEVLAHLLPIIIDSSQPPFLQNRAIYLVVRLRPIEQRDRAAAERKYRYGLVEIPSASTSRFVQLSNGGAGTSVMFLDDAIRLCLPELFPGYTVHGAWSIKLTRDAELYIGDEFSGDLLEKIRKALRRRSTGVPSRFLYDMEMPKSCLKFLKQSLSLTSEEVIPGGRYHNFNDLFSFPSAGTSHLEFEPLPPIDHELGSVDSIFDAIAERDHLLHFPYHSYDPVLRFLHDASVDPSVESIAITLYRVAANSRVAEALIEGARRGKKVTAFVEVKARFDEESNLQWAEEMERAGVRVLYSFPGLKVHAKLCLVVRRESEEERRYAYLGTGNFNEKTARIYCDYGFFTADPRITDDVASVFARLDGADHQHYHHLLVAPDEMRSGFIELIEKEIANARAGGDAWMILKMNSLEDEEMIEKLYEASCAGVKIEIIVRGICCLVPGVKGQSENIRVISIVDRFLEHARLYIFGNGGDERYYLASADWMTRNLSRRVEVAFPIYDRRLQHELRRVVDLQLADHVKGRMIDVKLGNMYCGDEKADAVSAQRATYAALHDGLLHGKTASAIEEGVPQIAGAL